VEQAPVSQNIPNNQTMPQSATTQSQAVPPVSAPVQQVMQDSSEHGMYNKAYQNVKARDYDTAIENLTKYINMYPKGLYTASSYYWLGEIYMLKAKPDKALVSFDKLLKNFPSDPKAPDAAYKRAMVYVHKKDFNKAKALFTTVVKQYSDSTAARLAQKQLQNIEDLNSIDGS
jgi:tol-pal system protein YbgF